MADEITEIPVSYRRYLLLNRLANMEMDEPAMAGVWRSKQEEQPNTPLPSNFPFLSTLAAVGYTAWEDLNGATTRELVRHTKLSQSDAAAVLSAFNKLTPP